MKPVNHIKMFFKNAAIRTDPQMDEAVLNEVLMAQEQAKEKESAIVQPIIWRTIMKSPITKIAATIAVACALIGSLWLLDRGTAVAFAEVIEKVTKAESVSFTNKQKLGPNILTFKMYIRGQKLRGDLLDFQPNEEGVQEKIRQEMQQRNLTGLLTYIADFARKEHLQLDHFRKTYKQSQIDERAASEFAKTNLIEQFRNVKEENAEWLGEEKQDGRRIDVYLVKHVELMGIKAELSGEPGERMKVWVDRQSSLPVRILLEISARADGPSDDWLEYYDFTWNEPLEDDLFSLEVPEGYTLADPLLPY
jgi:hypothetical protein